MVGTRPAVFQVSKLLLMILKKWNVIQQWKSRKILLSFQRAMTHKSPVALRHLTLELEATGVINEGLKSSMDWNLHASAVDWLLVLRQILF